MKIKTSELVGLALDYAVAKALGWTDYPDDSEERGSVWHLDPVRTPFGSTMRVSAWTPSTSWAQGGPLMEAYKPWMSPPVLDPDPGQPFGWDAEIYDEGGNSVIGHVVGCPTVLVAVCRAIVASKLGDEVEVPDESVGV